MGNFVFCSGSYFLIWGTKRSQQIKFTPSKLMEIKFKNNMYTIFVTFTISSMVSNFGLGQQPFPQYYLSEFLALKCDFVMSLY